MSMRALSAIAICAIAWVVITNSHGEEHRAESSTKAPATFVKLVEACKATDWPAESAARLDLVALGREALPLIQRGAKTHEDARVRRACFEILIDAFSKEQSTGELIASSGLRDRDGQIRYICAFQLGELGIESSKPRLRALLKDPADADLGFTVAKSLAQLGEADVLPTLYLAVSSDRYMDRYIGNRGLKGLTGKDLNDFEGYRFEEGCCVIGGMEMQISVDPITRAERSAKRFTAITAYFKWLKQEKPELYAEFDFTRKQRERRAARLKEGAASDSNVKTAKPE
jgi:HEAT repeat protein